MGIFSHLHGYSFGKFHALKRSITAKWIIDGRFGIRSLTFKHQDNVTIKIVT